MTEVVAEIANSHQGSPKKAEKLALKSLDNGADAVKLQTYKPETITRNFGADCGDTMWGRQKLYDLYSAAQTPWDWHKLLRDEAHARVVEDCPGDSSVRPIMTPPKNDYVHRKMRRPCACGL